MSFVNATRFAIGELNELNNLLYDLKPVLDLHDVTSWLNPTKTYASYNYQKSDTNNLTSYCSILENIVDRLYLILNIILMKIEQCGGTLKNLCKPKRLTISSLSRIIVDKLSRFHRRESKKQITTQDIEVQTVHSQHSLQNPDGECKSCIILFKALDNTITHTFKDSIPLLNSKRAKLSVSRRICGLDNSQSMSIMCDAIHDDLRIFLDDYRTLNESHAALKLQYDKLMDGFINCIADYDANLAQQEDALKALTDKVNALHGGFAIKLQLLGESSTSIWEALTNQGRILAESKNEEKRQCQQIDSVQNSLQHLAQCMEQFNELESRAVRTITTSIDICAQKVALLQSRLRKPQPSDLKACNVSRKENDGAICNQHAGALAGNNPVVDMLQHIESNKLKIDYLQNENCTLQRTIERIKTRVTY